MSGTNLNPGHNFLESVPKTHIGHAVNKTETKLVDRKLVFKSEIPDSPNHIIILDTDETSPCDQYKNTLIFRTSLLKSKRRSNEFVLPAHMDYSFSDLINHQLEKAMFDPLYTNTPSVAYCGRIHGPRGPLVKVFEEQECIQKKIIKRNGFHKGQKNMNRNKKEFIETLKDYTFQLCARGSGNWSIRFYEVMAVGRIPVLLDTDSLLPHDHLIDWSDLIIFEKTPKLCYEKILEWHARGKDFILQKQIQIFDTWYNFLRPKVFFQHIQNHK